MNSAKDGFGIVDRFRDLMITQVAMIPINFLRLGSSDLQLYFSGASVLRM